MAFKLNHIHLKTPDPNATVKWYVDNLSAKVVSHNPAKGYKIDLHGLPVNISGFDDGFKHKQVYGFEHIAIDTDDLPGTVARLKANGVKILGEITGSGGHKICTLEGPQGVILEVCGSADMPKVVR